MKLPMKELVLVFVLVFLGWNQYQQRQDSRMMAALLQHQIALNDSTWAILASGKTRSGELEAVKTGAKELGGKLVAGVRLVTRADTVYVPLREAETTQQDSIRYAQVRDTTESGVEIAVDAEAPPYPAPLKLGYQVVVPPFTPEVGFVRVGDRYTAVVSWRGQQVQVEDAYFDATAKEVARTPAWALVNRTSWSGERKESALLVERGVGKLTLGAGPSVYTQEGDKAHFGWAFALRSTLLKSKN